MGCDIHFFVEIRRGQAWVSADKLTPSPYEDDKGKLRRAYGDGFYGDRNYELFAILADVRNGKGFAGCDTGDRFNPIDAPRGLPIDTCEFIRSESDELGEDGHSHSYFTVQELLNYDWTQITKLRGWVNAVTFFEWSAYLRDRGEMPKEYSGLVSGRDVKHVSAQEMEHKVQQLKSELPSRAGSRYKEIIAKLESEFPLTYCQIEVVQPYYKSVRRFWSDVIPRLLRLGEPSEVRIVFWFDN